MTPPIDVRIISDFAGPDWWTVGFTGAATIIGALIGASIAYVVARETAKQNAEAARTARRELEIAATLRAAFKLLQLVNEAGGYSRLAEQGIAENRKLVSDPNPETWLLMAALTSRATELHIDADDLIAFMHAREFPFATKFLFLVSRFNSMTHGVDFYSRRREELMAMITPVGEMRGLVGDISQEEKQRLAPYIAAVADLAEQARADIKSVNDLALSVLDEFGPIARKYFDDPNFPIPGRAKVEDAPAAAAGG